MGGSVEKGAARRGKSILTPGQRRLLHVVLVAAVLILANSAYLLLTTPREAPGRIVQKAYEVSPYGRAGIGPITAPQLTTPERDIPVFYQSMLLAHIFGAALIIAVALAFVVWHLGNALRRHNTRAVVFGIAVVAATLALAISGLFILTQASSLEHRWIYRSHQILAGLVPLLYLGHRVVSYVPPRRAAIWTGVLAVAGLILVFIGVHTYLQHRDTWPVAPAHAMSEPSTVAADDPFLPFRPTNLGYPGSKFFPSAAGTTTGDYITRLTLTQDDLAPQAVMEADIKTYGFLLNGEMGSATCARCHPSVVEQWSHSAHRFSSFNNPFYKASVENLRTEKDGHLRSQWCGGCHDPNLMFAGKMLGEVNPLWPESQAGLTCLACHAIDSIHGKAGNGNYNLSDNAPDPYLFRTAKSGPGQELHDMLVKSKPTVHKRQMLKPFFRSSEYCLTCHKVSLDLPVNDYRWLRGQNEYDNWHDSGVARNASRTFYLPEQRKVCQDCHMPLEAASRQEVSAKNGMVRSHRFLAVNTALPYVRGDQDTIKRTEEFLRKEKMIVDVFALRRLSASGEPAEPIPALDKTQPGLVAGEEVEFEVVVRNKGVGHTFPGGTNDSNEGWIDFEVRDDQDRVITRSGILGEDGRVDPDAHMYKVLFVDEHSNAVLKRDPQNFHAMVYAHVIGPGTDDLVHYRVRIPSDAAGRKLTVTAKLKWRKFNRDFTEFVFSREKLPQIPALTGKTIPELPVTEITSAQVTLAVASEARPPDLAKLSADDWMRFNDYGIGNFLQGSNQLANWAFAKEAELAPARIDGPRNLARVAVIEGRVSDAIPLLERCEKIAPGDARTALWWGLTKKKQGLYDEAEKALERVLAYFPEDRQAWQELGHTRYLDGRYQEALNAFLEVLAIDPEDRPAQYWRMLSYQALGQVDNAAEAEKAYNKYKLDDSQAEVTQRYRLEHAADNREWQTIHLHDARATP